MFQEFNQGDAVVRSIRVGSIAFACWVADPAQNTVLPVDSKRAHRMLARACLHTINTACTALEVRAAKDRLSRVMPLDPISPLLGYAISHTLTHLRVLQHFRHLSAVLSRASYLCLRACVGPRSANAIVPDFIAAIEHLSEFAGTSSAAPADKETSLAGPPAPLPVIGVSTIRLYNQDVVGSGDGAGNHEDVASAIRGAHRLHLYHRFFDANKAVLASEPDRLFPIVWELDPTNPVRVRTRQQVLRACQRASSKPETDPAFAESDDEAEQDDVSEVDSSSSDVTDSLSEGETESDSSSSSHSSPSRISGSNSHPASLARDSDATSDSDADAATPIRRVLPPSRTISSPTRPPSIALQSTSKMLSTLRQHTGAASTTQPLPAATAVSLSRTIRGAVAAEPVVIPRDAARVLSSHTGWVNSVAVSDDGRRLVSCGADNTVRVWQPNTGTLLCTLEPGVHTTQLSKSGVTQCDARRLVSLWSVSLSGDGVTVAAGGEDCTVYVWNTESGRLTWSLGGFEGHSSWIACVALDTPGSAVLSSGRDSLLRHWSLDTGRLLHAYKGHTGTIWSCAFIDSGRYAVSSGADGTCRIWDVDTGSAIAVFSVCKGDVFSVTASSLRPGVVVCGGWDGRVSAWDWTHQELMWEHFGHKDESGTATAVRSVWMSEDGRFVFSGSDDGVVGRVDAENGEDMVSLRGHAGPVTGVMSSFDGLHLFSGGRDGTVRVWTFT